MSSVIVMEHLSSCVAVYPIRAYANVLDVIKQLQAEGYSVRQLSVIAKVAQFSEGMKGAHRIYNKFIYKRDLKEFWYELSNLLEGEVFLQMPDIGSLTLRGGLSDKLLSSLDKNQSDNFRDLDRLLYFVGIPESSFKSYESALKRGQLILIASGNNQEIEDVSHLIELSSSADVSLHLANTN